MFYIFDKVFFLVITYNYLVIFGKKSQHKKL